MGMPEPGYPRAGSRRQCEAVFWSTSLGLPLPLLLGISGHEASSQRKLGGSKCTGFSWSAKHSSLALLLHMSKLPFRPADVSLPSQLQPDADVPSCNPWRETPGEREKLLLQSLEEEALGESEREIAIQLKNVIWLSSFNLLFSST